MNAYQIYVLFLQIKTMFLFPVPKSKHLSYLRSSALKKFAKWKRTNPNQARQSHHQEILLNGLLLVNIDEDLTTTH